MLVVTKLVVSGTSAVFNTEVPLFYNQVAHKEFLALKGEAT